MISSQVMVVEDERILAKAIQDELRSMGYHVPIVAVSGEEALEKAEQTHPDIVLMDIVLKGNLDGVQAAQRIREKLDIPVIFLTGYSDPETLARAKLTEPFGYLLKPFDINELRTTIEMALFKHRMERKLKETNQWLNTTLQSINEALLVTDSRLTVRLLNAAAEDLTGCRREAALGQDLAEVCPLATEKVADLVGTLAAQAKQQLGPVAVPPDAFVGVTSRPKKYVEGQVAPLLDDEGTFEGIVLVLRDVSARRESEQLQRQREESERQTQKMAALSRLAGGVAHELNNLLTVILGHASLARAWLAPLDPLQQHLDPIETTALRAAGVVKQLLAFSRQGKSHPQVLNLNRVIEELLEALRPTLDSRIILEYRPTTKLWPLWADLNQMHELVANLLRNAQEAMPEGGRLEIETANIAVPQDQLPRDWQVQSNHCVRLRVSDMGRGIAVADQSHIFEPFFTTKQPGAGPGLGLAVAYGIVQEHRGWIECASVAGQGTRFDVYLPRYWIQVDLPYAVSPPPSPLPATQPTILLVDDEPLIQEVGAAILHSQGYQVLLASDGVEAVEVYQREHPRIDLVILDWYMPRMSGRDALRHLVEIDQDVAVLFCSSYLAEDMAASEQQVLGFLSKPFGRDELVNVVREALARRRCGVSDEMVME